MSLNEEKCDFIFLGNNKQLSKSSEIGNTQSIVMFQCGNSSR